MKKQLLLFVMMVLPFMASAHDIEVQNADNVVAVMILIQANIKAMLLFLKK